MKSNSYRLLSGVKQELCTLVLSVLSITAFAQASYTFNFTGGAQTLNISAGMYEIHAWGANGGAGGDASVLSGTGGIGGYSYGVYTAATPTTLYIYVGEKGQSTNSSGANMATALGGWNGGGAGWSGSSNSYYRGGGGGGTDVRLTQNTIYSDRIIVAGGGGGAGGSSGTPATWVGSGGNGGGTAGQDGVLAGSQTNHNGKGGSQTGGGAGGVYSSSNGGAGSFGIGGDGGGTGNAFPAGGGGGGWYGGGGGAVQGGGGGGGSAYIGGVTSGTTLMVGQTGFVVNPDGSGNGLVIIKELCDVNLSASSNPICEGASVTLSTNAGSNIQWSTGGTGNSVIVSPSVTTIYTLTGKSSSTLNCTSTLTLAVVVNPLPTLTLSVQPAVLCVGNTASVLAMGAASYSYSFGASTGNTTTVNPATTTIYSVTGISAMGCSRTQSLQVFVNPNQLLLSPDTAICAGQPANLRVQGAQSVMWSFGAPFANALVYPAGSTSYSVSGTDVHGCTLTGSVAVTVNPLPVISASTTASVVCRGDAFQLSASGATNYQWTSGGTIVGNDAIIDAVADIDIPLNYVVTGGNQFGCTSSQTVTVLANACVGIEEQNFPVFTVYPNPVKDVISISAPKGHKQITLYDLTGKEVLTVTDTGERVTIALSELSPGVYYLSIEQAATKAYRKIIIE